MPSFNLSAGESDHVSFSIGVSGGSVSVSLPSHETDHAAFVLAVGGGAVAVPLAAHEFDHVAFAIGTHSLLVIPLATHETDKVAFNIGIGGVIPVAIATHETDKVLFAITAGNSHAVPFSTHEIDSVSFNIHASGTGSLSATCPQGTDTVTIPYNSGIVASGGVTPYLSWRPTPIVPLPSLLNVVALGDSLTVGYPVDPTGSYPTQLGTFLGLSVSNRGINGEHTSGILSTEVPLAITDVIPGHLNVAYVQGGINDWLGGVPLATTQVNVKAIVVALKAGGFNKVIAITCSASAYSGQPATIPATIAAFNAWLLAGGSGADAVSDSGNDPRLLNPANTTYFQADGLHLTFSGYQVMEQYAAAAITGALPPGLALSTTNGNIVGVPTTPGTYKFWTTITDSAGGTYIAKCQIIVFQLTPLSGTCRTILYLWQHSAAPQVEIIADRNDDWTNCGTDGLKFFQGFRLDADTFGNNKNIQIRDADTGNLHVPQPSPINHNGRQTMPYSFATPFLAHSVRRESLDSVLWRKFGISYEWQPAPEFTYTWKTQRTAHGQKGFHHVQRMLFAYAATATVTLTLTSFDGVSPQVVQLPPTAGVYQKAVVVFTFNKGLLYEYLATSPAPFQIWKQDLEVMVGGWGRTNDYVNYPLLGGDRGDEAKL